MVFLDFIQHVSSISFNVFLNIVRITNFSSENRLLNWLHRPVFNYHDLRNVYATARLALWLVLGDIILLLLWRAGVAQGGHILRK